MNCKICGQNLAPGHPWKSHRVKEVDYFYKYEPRFSKQTGKPIEFKTRDFYLKSDFNNKKEMASWMKFHPEEAKTYAVELLKKRKAEKKLLFELSQVELRSLGYPTIQWFQENVDDYGVINKTIGLKSKFTPVDRIFFRSLPANAVVIIDTREQKPLRFSFLTNRKKLDFADYAIADPDGNGIYIERKSLSDFVGTFSTAQERFEREIQRAVQGNAKIVVLIEASYEDATKFRYIWRTRYSKKSSPEFVFHSVRNLMHKYANLQFVFGGPLSRTTELAHRILSLKPDIWPDLQLAVELGKI